MIHALVWVWSKLRESVNEAYLFDPYLPPHGPVVRHINPYSLRAAENDMKNETKPVGGNSWDVSYTEHTVPGPEYRVRAIVRYAVTVYYHGFTSADGKSGCSGSSQKIAEFDNEQRAYEVAQALAKADIDTATVSV